MRMERERKRQTDVECGERGKDRQTLRMERERKRQTDVEDGEREEKTDRR